MASQLALREEKEMDAQVDGINEADLLDLEIPDSDLADPVFTSAHKSVRATIVAAKLERDDREDSEHFGKFEWVESFVISKNQPDHPDLEIFAGMRIPFVRFKITAGQNKEYKDQCRQFNADPKRPDPSLFIDQPVILAIKTNTFTYKRGPKTGEEATKHNVNRVVRDLEV